MRENVSNVSLLVCARKRIKCFIARVCEKTYQMFLCEGALFQKLVLPAFGQGKFVACMAVKENLTSVQEIFCGFGKQKTALT